MTVLGIDVSVWQDNNSTPQKMDFTKAYDKGARFVFIKGSQANWADEDILYNWKSAKDAGLLRGAYHFFVWNVDPIVQAQYAWSIIHSDPGEMPPVVDFEYWGTPPANASDLLWKYVREMERLSGRKPIVYTGAFFWKDHGTGETAWKNYPLWIASYTDQTYMENNVKNITPWDTWTFWQYTSKGDGIAFGAESSGLDMDLYPGSYEDLQKFCGITSSEPPTEPPTPVDGFTPEEAKRLDDLIRTNIELYKDIKASLEKADANEREAVVLTQKLRDIYK